MIDSFQNISNTQTMLHQHVDISILSPCTKLYNHSAITFAFMKKMQSLSWFYSYKSQGICAVERG